MQRRAVKHFKIKKIRTVREIKAYTREKSLGLDGIHQMCNGKNTSDLEREKSTQDAVITS